MTARQKLKTFFARPVRERHSRGSGRNWKKVMALAATLAFSAQVSAAIAAPDTGSDIERLIRQAERVAAGEDVDKVLSETARPAANANDSALPELPDHGGRTIGGSGIAASAGGRSEYSDYLLGIAASMKDLVKPHPVILVDRDAVRRMAAAGTSGPEAVKDWVRAYTGGAVLTDKTAQYAWERVNQDNEFNAGWMSRFNDLLDQASPVEKICLAFASTPDRSAKDDAIWFMNLDNQIIGKLHLQDRKFDVSKDAMRRFLDYRGITRCTDYRYTPHPEGRTDIEDLRIYHKSEVFSDVFAALLAARDGHTDTPGRIADFRSVEMQMAKREIFIQMGWWYKTDWIATILWTSAPLRAAQNFVNSEGAGIRNWTTQQLETKAYEITEWNTMATWQMETFQRSLEEGDAYLNFLLKEYRRSHLPKDKQCPPPSIFGGPPCKPVDPMDVKRFHFMIAVWQDFNASVARVAGTDWDGKKLPGPREKTKEELEYERAVAAAKEHAKAKVLQLVDSACGPSATPQCQDDALIEIRDRIRQEVYSGAEDDPGMKALLKDWDKEFPPKVKPEPPAAPKSGSGTSAPGKPEAPKKPDYQLPGLY
jgi:hypothetical protein